MSAKEVLGKVIIAMIRVEGLVCSVCVQSQVENMCVSTQCSREHLTECILSVMHSVEFVEYT